MTLKVKPVIALVLAGIGAWIGFSLSDPVYMAAAHHLCSAHADDTGLELVAYEGEFVYRHRRNWFRSTRSPAYWCEFEDSSGNTIHLDEVDRVMRVTWASRGLRFIAWFLIVVPIVAGMALAGYLGLLKRQD